MAFLVDDCPRCGAKKMTFDVTQQHLVGKHYHWQHWFELFCVCRNCYKSTTFLVTQKDSTNKQWSEKDALLKTEASLNIFFRVERYIGLREHVAIKPPEYIPENIESCFNEGATCLATGCWNAASAMFRKCVDLSTRAMLPEEEKDGLNKRQRRDLGLRLQWLFDNKMLSTDLYELSSCIREDANDGVHGEPLKQEDAEDLLDFTVELLERIYTEPKSLELAKERRIKRRTSVAQ